MKRREAIPTAPSITDMLPSVFSDESFILAMISSHVNKPTRTLSPKTVCSVVVVFYVSTNIRFVI